MIVCFLILIVIILVYLWLIRNRNYWKNKNVPYIKPTLLFGTLYQVITLRKSFPMLLNELYDQLKAPFVGYFMFNQPSLLIRDPDLIKKVLITDFSYFCDRNVFFNKNDKYSAKTLFILKNPQWRLTRNKVTSIFSSRKFKNMIPLIVNASDQLINKIKTISLCNDSIDVRDLCLKYGIDVISLCGFRFEAKAQENSQFQSAARNLLGETLLRNIATSSYFYSPFLVKLFGFNFFDRKSAEFLEKVLLNIIQNRKVSKQLHGDMTDMLIQMIENPHFDLNGGISLALNLIIAGFETTGNVLSYILYELCLNQSIQDRLGEEIFHTTTQKHESISLHAILEMKYLEMVVKEGLRKYPPLPFLDRVCTNNYTIPGTDVVIEKGTPVFISIWALHHDQNNFKNPEIFDPDRFSSANKSNIISCTYMPFGEGHRNCIGTNLGILAISIALIQILKHFKLELRDTSLKLNTKSTSFLLVPSDNVLYLKFKPIA